MTFHTKSRTKRYLSVFLRWVGIAVGVFAVTTLAGIYLTDNLLSKVYAAKAVMQIQPHVTDDVSSVPTSIDATHQAQFQILESPEILGPIITDLGLDKTWADRIFASKEPLSSEDSLRYLERNIRINFKRGTNVVEIIVTSDVPNEAAQLANAIVDRYKVTRDAENNRRTQPGTISESAIPQARAPHDSPVVILARAEPPTEPTKPNKRLCYAITAAVAGLLSVMIASSVEIVFLISRAAEEAGGELLPAR